MFHNTVPTFKNNHQQNDHFDNCHRLPHYVQPAKVFYSSHVINDDELHVTCQSTVVSTSDWAHTAPRRHAETANCQLFLQRFEFKQSSRGFLCKTGRNGLDTQAAIIPWHSDMNSICYRGFLTVPIQKTADQCKSK